MDLTDSNTFGILIFVCLFFYCAIGLTIRALLKKKGVDIDSSKNLLKLALGLLPIVAIPFWIHPLLSIQFKLFITLVATAGAIANYYAVDRGGKAFRKYFGIETAQDKKEGDRREKEIKDQHG